MTKYLVDLTIEIDAESKVEVVDILNNLLRNNLDTEIDFELSDSVDSDLFGELGVHYD